MAQGEPFPFHFQDRERIALSVGFRTFEGSEAQMAVKALRLRVLLVYIHISYIEFPEGHQYQFFPDAHAPEIRCDEKHFNLVFFETDKTGRNVLHIRHKKPFDVGQSGLYKRGESPYVGLRQEMVAPAYGGFPQTG